jgi:hypothetical protein
MVKSCKDGSHHERALDLRQRMGGYSRGQAVSRLKLPCKTSGELTSQEVCVLNEAHTQSSGILASPDA